MMNVSIFRMHKTQSETGYSRSTIYLYISKGLWVKPVKLGARAIGFPANEVSAIISARVAGKSDEQIRELVLKLEASRKDLA